MTTTPIVIYLACENPRRAGREFDYQQHPSHRAQPAQRVLDWEGFRAVESGINPKQVKRCDGAVAAQRFRRGSGRAGRLYLCRGDRGYSSSTRPGTFWLARRIDGVKAADVARLSDTPLEALPSGEASATVRAQREQPGNVTGVPLPATPWRYRPAAFPISQATNIAADLSASADRPSPRGFNGNHDAKQRGRTHTAIHARIGQRLRGKRYATGRQEWGRG